MNRNTITRILERSPAESLAALSASAFFRGDITEHERVFAAIPSHSKTSRREFLIQHHAMAKFVLLWAVEYWKTIATIRACLIALLAADNGDGDDISAESAFLADAYKAKQASLVEAMRQICDQTGISFDDVAGFAEIEPCPEAAPIPKLVSEYVDTYSLSKTA